MTAIGWLLLAMLLAVISIVCFLWICPRLFRYVQRDDE